MSGQSKWYEPSDWATAWIAADLLTKIYECDFYRAGMLLAEFNHMAAMLLTTDGERRRLRVELIKAGGNPDEDEADLELEGIKGRILTPGNVVE
jgi:hypothetical protein